MAKIAVVLFNLGGPDQPRAVRPFLFNLFNDPAIIGAPGPLRWLLAKFISWRRAPIAREIYKILGGASPLLANTEAQARALESALASREQHPGTTTDQWRAFIAMRYWHPLAPETAAAVKVFDPDRIVLLPLYPQFSTTTSGSSLTDWAQAAKAAGLSKPTRSLCCYPDEPGFVAEAAAQVRPALEEARRVSAEAGISQPPRLLFSAHGLPKKVIERGDPYQWQVERTAAAVAQALDDNNLDWRLCYQSRVGPLEWIGPSIEDEITAAGREGRAVVVAPIAFVSEHSETLVELDVEYRHFAAAQAVPFYFRAPVVADGPAFIKGLAAMARTVDGQITEPAQDLQDPVSQAGTRICRRELTGCPCA